MKKWKELWIAIGFAGIVVSVMTVLTLYHTTFVGRLADDVSVVTDVDIYRAMKTGSPEEGSGLNTVGLESLTPIYTRTADGTLFAGENKLQVNSSLPFYVNDGSAVNFMVGDAVLFSNQFERFNTYTGMYVTDGHNFNYDKSQADEETFLFAGLNNGLFLNTLDMQVDIPGLTYGMPANSILYMDTENLRYYVNDGGKFSYKEMPTVSMATVTIGGATMTYGDLLYNLGIIEGGRDYNGEDVPGTNSLAGQGEGETAPEEYPLIPEEAVSGGDEENQDGDKTEGNKQGAAQNQGASVLPGKDSSSASAPSGNAQDQDAQDGTDVNGPDADDANGEEQEGSENGGGQSSSSGDQSNKGGQQSNGQSGGKPGTGNTTGAVVDVPGGDEPFVKPTVSLSNITTDIYNLGGTLAFDDPSGVLKRVAIELYWIPSNSDGTAAADTGNKADYQLQYRKTYRNDGPFTIDNLPPNTTIYVKGLMTYYNKGLETVEETFYDSFQNRVKTLPVSVMDPVYVDFDSVPSNQSYLYQQNKINIYNICLSGPNHNVLNKINRMVVHVETKDKDNSSSTGVSDKLITNGSAVKHTYVYNVGGADYTSDTKQFMVPANSTVNYEICLYDSFGNKLTNLVHGYQADTVAAGNTSLRAVGETVTSPYVPLGSTETCKVTPKLDVNLQSVGTVAETIEKLTFNVALSDPNNAMTSGVTLTLYGPDGSPVTKPDGSVYEYIIGKEKLAEAGTTGVNYAFDGLTAGQTYTVKAVGGYDLQNRAGSIDNLEMAAVSASTTALAAYGRVNYNITANYVKPEGEQFELPDAETIDVGINFRTTQIGLFTNNYFSSILAKLSNISDGSEIMAIELTKAKLESIDVPGANDGTTAIGLRTVSYTLSELAGDEGYRWAYGEKEMPEPTIEFTFTDYPTGTTKNLYEIYTDTTDGAVMRFNYPEHSLIPATPYELTLSTYATQGMADVKHDVSGRTNAVRRVQFTSLRRMPKVEYEDVMIYSGELHFYDVTFKDLDNAIYNGKITVSNGVSQQQYTIDYSSAEGGKIPEIALTDLRVGDTYTVTFSADQIRRTTSGVSYRYDNLQLFSYSFVAGQGISGKITLRSLANTLDPLNGETQGTLLREEFDLFNGDFAKRTYLNSNGTTTDNSTNWMTTNFIAVEPGHLYYMDHVRENDTYAGYIAFYDSDQNFIPGSYGYTYNGTYVRSPDNAAFVRYCSYSSYRGEYNIQVGGFYDMQKPVATMATQATAASVLDSGVTIRENGIFYGLKSTAGATFTIGESGCDIKAKPGVDSIVVFESNAGGTSNVSANEGRYFKVVFYNSADAELASVATAYRRAIEIPEGAVKAKLLCTNSTRHALVYSLDRAMIDWLESKDLDSMTAKAGLTVSDMLNNLESDKSNQTGKYTLKIFKDGKQMTDAELLPFGIDQAHFVLHYDAESLENAKDAAGKDTGVRGRSNIGLDCEAGSDYRMELSVVYRGRTLILDTIEFSADRPRYIIETAQDTYKLARYKEADFIVVNDIVMWDDPSVTHSSTYPFNGSVDFQNHSLTLNYKAEYGNSDLYFFHTLGNSAEICNLELNINVDCTFRRASIANCYGLSYYNYGDIHDFIVNYNLGSGYYQKNYTCSTSYYNYGNIYNFALYYDAGSYNYVGHHFGGLVYQNQGFIQNGLVYSPRWLQGVTGVYGGDSENADTSYSSLLCAYNPTGGLISNVYAVGTIGVERDKRYENNAISFNTNGVIVGYNYGGITRNCVSVGDMYEIYWVEDPSLGGFSRTYHIYDRYEPLGGAATSTNYINSYYQNCIFFSEVNGYPKVNVGGKLENGSSVLRLQDASFYNSNVNSQSRFNLEDLEKGFYPRVLLDDVLLNREMRIPFPNAGVPDDIILVSSDVGEVQTNESGKEYADVVLTFLNRRNYNISDINIDGLFVTTQDVEDATVTGEPYEQYRSGNYYKVKVRVWPNEMYHDSYDVRNFKVTLGSYNAVIGNVNRVVTVTFFKDIDQSNWLTDIKDDMSGNYRLVGDIDLAGFGTENVDAARVFANATSAKPFNGKLYGQGHVIRNLTELSAGQGATNQVSLIPYVRSAEIRDITFIDSTITNANLAKNSYMGILGYVDRQSIIHDVYVKNITLNGVYNNGGGLAGYVNSGTVYNCVVRNVAITAASNGTDLRLGGLVGYNYYSTINNCYTTSVNIVCDSGSASVAGAGGIAGSHTATAFIADCYAQGKINLVAGYAGGISGYANGNINRCWAKVDIQTGSGAGGIVGQADTSARISQLLSVGNVSGQAGITQRISGYTVSAGTKFTNAVAYDKQAINSVVSEELYDANSLMDDDKLMREPYYWDRVNLGYAFNYDDISNKALPKLYAKEGDVLLPWQDNDINFTLDGVVDFTTVEGSTAVFDEDAQKYTLTFGLTVKLPGLSAADKGSDPAAFAELLKQTAQSISIPGLRFTLPETFDESVYGFDAQGNLVISFNAANKETTGMTVTRCLDVYMAQLDYVDGASTGWTLQTVVDFGEPLYLHIYYAYNGSDEEDLKSWYGAMKMEGQNYQNILIMNDIDLSEIPAGKITTANGQTMLRIGRLDAYDFTEPSVNLSGEGSDEERIREYLLRHSSDRGTDTVEELSGTVAIADDRKLLFSGGSETPKITIRNLDYHTGAASQSWIYELRDGMKGIAFEHMSLTNSKEDESGWFAGSYVGLIAYNSGEMQWVDFTDVQLNIGGTSNSNGNYFGMVAYNRGKMDMVRLKDVRIINRQGSGADYVGGLAGRSVGNVTHCSAVGTRSGNDSTYNITLYSRSDTAHSTYTGGLIGYGNTEGYVRFCYVDGISVNARYQTGAVAGYVSCTYGYNTSYTDGTDFTRSDTFYYVTATNNYVSGRMYTGAAFGQSSDVHRIYSAHNTIMQTGTGAYGAGGIMGYNSGYTPTYLYSYDNTVTTTGDCAGGISGYNNSFSRVVVRDCKISGANRVGGIVGSMTDNGVTYSSVENTTVTAGGDYAGGIAGYSANHSMSKSTHWYDDKVSEGTTITASHYAGGLIGAMYSNNLYTGIVDDTVTVNAGDDYAGGLFGLFTGGTAYYCETGATVTSHGHTGGVAGYMEGYKQTIQSHAAAASVVNMNLSFPQSQVYGIIVGGNLKGFITGGFAGEFAIGKRPIDPDNNQELKDEDSGYQSIMLKGTYRRILIAPSSMTAENANNLFVDYYGKDKAADVGAEAGIGYLRVYEGIEYRTSGGANLMENATFTNRLNALVGTRKIAEIKKNLIAEVDAPMPHLVTYGVLQIGQFYYDSDYKTGSIFLNANATNGNPGNQRWFDYASMNTDTVTNKPTTFPMLRSAHSSAFLAHYNEILYGTKHYSTTDYRANFFSQYIGVSLTSDKGRDVMRVSTPQKGISLPKAAVGTASLYAAGQNDLGTVNAEVTFVTSNMRVYASGIDTISVDFPERYCRAGYTFTVQDVGGAVITEGSLGWLAGYLAADTAESEWEGAYRTLTLHYPYKGSLWVDVYDSARDDTTIPLDEIEITPQRVAYTMASYGTNQYYIAKRGGNSYVVSVDDLTDAIAAGQNAKEKPKEEKDAVRADDLAAGAAVITVRNADVVHLFDGKALDENGNIFSLDSGEKTGILTRESGTPAMLTSPAYRFIAPGGTVVSTYGGYSMVTAGETSAFKPYRLYVKQGNLYSFDAAYAATCGVTPAGVVVDTYNNGTSKRTYQSALTDEGKILDSAAALSWPKAISNSSISETAGTVEGEEPILLLRYDNNVVAGFNYLTGELVFIDEGDKVTQTFGDYVNGWFGILTETFGVKANSAYSSAALVASTLSRTASTLDDTLAANNMVIEGKGNSTPALGVPFATDGGVATVGGLIDALSVNLASRSTGVEAAAIAGTTADGAAQTKPNGSVLNLNGEANNAEGVEPEDENGQTDENSSEKTLSAAKSMAGKVSVAARKLMSSALLEANLIEEEEADLNDVVITAENAERIKSAAISALAADEGVQEVAGAILESGVPSAILYRNEGGQGGDHNHSQGTASSMDEADLASASQAIAQTLASDVALSMDSILAAEAFADEADGFVYMLNSNGSELEVYSMKSLLSTNTSGAVVSETEKLTALKNAGLYDSGLDLDSLKTAAQDNSRGLIFVGGGLGIMAALTGLLVWRRKKIG